MVIFMKKIIKELSIKLDQSTVIACISTGVDSMVLLDILEKVPTIKKIVVAHVNHHRRKESDEEAEFLKSYCEVHNLDYEICNLYYDDTENFQEWARLKRYEFFNETCNKYHANYILTAHHADDNLETILMRIIKTSSLKGYAGIEQEVIYRDNTIYRPFLKVPKAKLIEYATLNKLIYYEDVSNKSDDYTRNRLRKYVIPQIKKENPLLYEAIDAYSKTLLEASNIVEEKVKKFINDEIDVNNNSMFEKEKFLNLTDYLQVEVLFRVLKKYQLSKVCINDIIKQIKSTKNNLVNHVNPNLIMIKEYGKVYFVDNKDVTTDFYLWIEEDGKYVLPNNATLIVNKNICYFKTFGKEICYNILELPIKVRNRQDGDRIKTKAGTKTVSNFLTTRKVSHLDRMQMLVMCDKNDNIIALLGLRYK